MQYGICLLPVVPLRSEAAETAEQCSQLVFGDVFSILEASEKNSYIKLWYDDYEGWIDRKQYIEIGKDEFFLFTRAKALYTGEFVNEVRVSNDRTGISYMARLPFASRIFSKCYKVGNYEIDASEACLLKEETFCREKLEAYLENYLYTPYLWGGKSNFATDCSGFTQSIFKMFGIRLSRDASQQFMQGNTVASLNEAKAGDLAFFSNNAGKIVHVGILLSKDSIVHASAYVRLDKIDDKGIFRVEDGVYSHSLKQIRRFFI